MTDGARQDGPVPSHGDPDSGLASAAAAAVARFVAEWAAMGFSAEKSLDAVSAAVVEVRLRNCPVAGAPLATKLDRLVESGGLPPPEPEEDLLGGTDLDATEA